MCANVIVSLKMYFCIYVCICTVSLRHVKDNNYTYDNILCTLVRY